MTAEKDDGYIVIARKWRPSTFDEVVGQEHVTRTLKNAITGERVAHAYLFTGPRGVGKTTVARVLAKSLNCQQGPAVEPCGKCSACVEIAQGTSLDVIEIDGASNRGIDEIRNLRESVRYAPVGGKKKVYIIDEVHMLTPEAFNALLKTLEEPPPHVVFIFATTQPLKVPQTIVSRCQRFDFRRIPAGLIAERLGQICQADGYKCEAAALTLIAQRVEGSMRDAQSMLEQVLAFSGGAATEEDIRPIMGLRGSQTVSAIGRAIVDGDDLKVLRLLAEAFDAGIDPLDLVSSLTEWMRFLLIASIDPDSRELLNLTEQSKKELLAEGAKVPAPHLLSLLSMIADAENSIKRASHQRYLLETVVLRMTQVKSIARVSDLLEMLKQGSQGGPSRATPEAAQDEPHPRSPRKADRPKKPSQGTVAGAGADVVTSWNDVVESLREKKASLASILDLCEPPRLSQGIYWLYLPTSFHESQVLKGQNLRILTEEVQKLTNTSVTIRTKVSTEIEQEKDEQPPDLDSVVDKDPVIRALVDSLGGKVVGIRRPKASSQDGATT
jgi:DNA polymerase-3 subunit gamma/tau